MISRLCCRPSGAKAAPHEPQLDHLQRSLVSSLRNQNDVETTEA
jgi:hypothetical protein